MFVSGFPPINTISMNDVINIVELDQNNSSQEVHEKLKRIFIKRYNQYKLNSLIDQWSKII